MSKVHGEIEYKNKDGLNIHSDICPPDCAASNLTDKEYRKLLHTILDEWLDKSGGTGIFYLKEEGYKPIMHD